MIEVPNKPVDIGFEIAGLEIERDDLKRDMRWNYWLTPVAAGFVWCAGPEWFTVLDWTQVTVVYVGLALLVGLTEKLNKNRLAQIHGQITLLRLALDAEFQSHRQTLAALDNIRELDAASGRSTNAVG